MIRYSISRAQLQKLVNKEKPGWLDRAKQRTKDFEAAGVYSETSSIWSEVKPVYMRLQGQSKCIYCERKLESEAHGKGEQDVEHFRPKGSVRAWKGSTGLSKAGVVISPVPKAAPGYHLLPYDLFNYGASCKPCNSALKSDCFPVAGSYDFNGATPETLMSEKPLLIYPLGDFDSDPEKLIGFHGVSPMALATREIDRHRALVTIEFFQLDDFDARKNLVRERAAIILALYPQLEVLSNAAGKKAMARRIVDAFVANEAPHANCARSFVQLHARDRVEAAAVCDQALAFMEGSS